MLNDSGVDINVLPVWEYTKGEGVKIGVLDTGMDTSHPDLAANIAPGGYNFIHNSADLFPSEAVVKYINDDGIEIIEQVRAEDGHGMHVAGIVGAVGNNEEGIIGVAPESKILPIKVLGSTLANEVTPTNPAQNLSYNDVILEGLEYAVDQGCKIINMSLSGPDYDDRIYDFIKNNSSVLFVFCAGNGGDGSGNEGVNIGQSGNELYPACYNLPNTITVANNQKNGDLFADSNYGGSTQIAAPGTQILSTMPGDTCCGLFLLEVLAPALQIPSNSKSDGTKF